MYTIYCGHCGVFAERSDVLEDSRHKKVYMSGTSRLLAFSPYRMRHVKLRRELRRQGGKAATFRSRRRRGALLNLNMASITGAFINIYFSPGKRKELGKRRL